MSSTDVGTTLPSAKSGKRRHSSKPIVKLKSPNGKKKPSKIQRREGRWAYTFISPFYIMFIIFGMAPIIYSVYIAFFTWDPLDATHQYVGLQNFRDLWHDSLFWMSLRNTFSIWILSTIPQMFMALGLASILRNPKLRGRVFWQTIFLVPNITSAIAIAVVFGQLFGRDFGLINIVRGYLGMSQINWIEGTLSSHIAIATMITWRWVGYNALIFLASMNAISRDLYESASLDGASRLQQFFYVTLPQLKNTITFMLVVGTIGGLQVFGEPATLGGSFDGGDNHQFSTLTLYLFKQVKDNFAYGMASAIGIAITAIVAIISAFNFFLTRRISGD